MHRLPKMLKKIINERICRDFILNHENDYILTYLFSLEKN